MYPLKAEGITRLARTDWLVMILVTFPHIFYDPLMADNVGSALLQSFITGSLLFLMSGFLGICIDRVRGLSGAPSKPLDQKATERLREALNTQGLHHSSLIVTRIRFVPSDHTMGAHVRGVFIPHVVISAGLLIGVLRKDPKAQAILCHEIAHIVHYDRLLPGFIGLVALETAGNLFKFLRNESWADIISSDFLLIASWRLFVFILLVSSVSKYREYFADARALAMVKDRESYLVLLKVAARNERGSFHFFHPSLAKRISEACADFPVLRRGLFWRIYLPMNALISLEQWMMLDGFISEYARAGFFVSMACLPLQFFRGWLLKPRQNTEPNGGELQAKDVTPGSGERTQCSRWRPIGFLLVGFVVVVVVAGILQLGSTGMTIGGAIIYMMYRSMKY